MCMWAFFCFCCYWRPLLLHSDLIGTVLFRSSCICWGLSCDQLYDGSWKKYHEALRKRYILLLRMKYVKSNWSKTSISFTLSLFSFCFPDQSIEESVVLKSPTIIVVSAMCALKFLLKVLLWMSVPLHLEHRCSELRVLLGGFFLWPARSVPQCHFWWL